MFRDRGCGCTPVWPTQGDDLSPIVLPVDLWATEVSFWEGTHESARSPCL